MGEQAAVAISSPVLLNAPKKIKNAERLIEIYKTSALMADAKLPVKNARNERFEVSYLCPSYWWGLVPYFSLDCRGLSNIFVG